MLKIGWGKGDKNVILWATTISIVFELSPSTSAVQDAMILHHNATVKNVDNMTCDTRPGLMDYSWCAAKIHSLKSTRKSYARLSLAERKPSDTTVTLVDDQGIPFVRASLDTKEGDYFLMSKLGSRAYRYEHVGIIIRPSGNARYSFVGLTAQCPLHAICFAMSLKLLKIEIAWDPYDVLLFGLYTRDEKDSVETLLDYQICSSKDSSFAQNASTNDEDRFLELENTPFETNGKNIGRYKDYIYNEDALAEYVQEHGGKPSLRAQEPHTGTNTM